MERILGPGSIVNVLCLLGVWPASVETVKCDETTEAYGINTEEFTQLFHDEQVPTPITPPTTIPTHQHVHDKRHQQVLWRRLQAFASKTMHMMVPDRDAPTEHGMPVFVLPPENIAEREMLFELREKDEMKNR